MRSDARKRLTEKVKPLGTKPHHDPAVCELIARAWDEGHSATDEHGPGLCECTNPYEGAA